MSSNTKQQQKNKRQQSKHQLNGAKKRASPNKKGGNSSRAAEDKSLAKERRIVQEMSKKDPRFGRNGMRVFETLSNQTTAITIPVELQSGNIWAFSLGYVTRAVEKGFLARQQQPFNANFALQYLVSILEGFSTNAKPLVSELPYCLAAFCQAIKPKDAPLGNGAVKYTFQNIAQGLTPNNIPIGALVYGSAWTSGAAEGVKINQFPTVSYAGWPAYDADLGANAFQDLNTFMKESGNDAYRIVPVTTKTSLMRDVSAYCTSITTVGAGSPNGAGGLGTHAELEVPVFRPFLSTFNSLFTPPSVADRNGTCVVSWAGDPTFIGASIGVLFPESEWKTNRYPKLHPVDFLEFGDVLAQWVVGITNAYCSAVASQAPLSSAALLALQCPLTLQEVLIVLRSTIMCAFKDSQAAVQGLLPILPAVEAENQFAPYVAGTNTCYLGGSDMSLPQPMIENIRSLVGRRLNEGTDKAEWFLPILGQFYQDELTEDDYTASYNAPDGTSTTFNVFKSKDALYQKTIVERGVSKVQVSAEVPISLIDGAYATGYVCINNPSRLKELTTMWNDWLTTTTQLSTYSVPLLKLGTEHGINALCSITMTRYLTVPAPTSSDDLVDVRKSKPSAKHIYNTVYANWSDVGESSQGCILSAPYEQILKNWILPVVRIGSFSSTYQAAQKWQALMNEPFFATLSQGEDGTILSEMHASYAAAMVKGATASQSGWTAFFSEMALQGRGGILSGLVASLVGSVVPSLGPAANQIAGMVPF